MSKRRSTVAMVTALRATLWASALLFGSACERTTNLASSRRDAGSHDPRVDASPSDASSSDDRDARPPFSFSDAGVVLCGETPCVCANQLDDDNDGFVDGFDAECTGPYDQDEATFATGEVKEGNPKCGDCFFDGNPGSGDDGCRVATSCASNGTSSGGAGSCETCTPTAECVNNCLPRTPNGCDCFGCCEVAFEGRTLAVQLVDSCSLSRLADAVACPRCMPADDCKNECGRCELCPGKTLADLPADCGSGSGPGYSCDNGERCGADGVCTDLAYCVQGCCAVIVF